MKCSLIRELDVTVVVRRDLVGRPLGARCL
jgi:hypothetical protein